MRRGVQFKEWMKGWLSFDETDHNQAMRAGRSQGTTVKLRLTIRIGDLDSFLADRSARARADGFLECDELGGRLMVERGWFQLYAREPDARHARMRYQLYLRDPLGRPLTLRGFKLVEDDPNFDSWRDTTTLFFRLFPGHREEVEERPGHEAPANTVATGIARLGVVAVMHEALSFRGHAPGLLSRLRAVVRFQWFFLRELALIYYGRPVADTLPSFPRDRRRSYDEAIDWHEVPGHPGLEREIVPYQTEDGVWSEPPSPAPPRRDTPQDAQPVMLAHGAGVRAQLFYGQPSGISLAERLLEEGTTSGSRTGEARSTSPGSSTRMTTWPATTIRPRLRRCSERADASTLKAIVHCQGSINFTASAVSGLLPDVTHVVSSAVSLHIRVTLPSRVKQLLMLPLADLVLPGYDAQWGIRSPSIPANFFAGIAGLVRRDVDCRNPVCATANYMYGAGPDVLLRHSEIDRDVHEWLGRELGYSTFGFVNQLVNSVGAGALVPAQRVEGLPPSYVDGPPDTRAAFTFIYGTENRMFLPEGQRLTFEHFKDHAPVRPRDSPVRRPRPSRHHHRQAQPRGLRGHARGSGALDRAVPVQ